MKIADMKEGMGALWGSLAEGWRHLKQSAATALTHFKPGERSGLPARTDVDDDSYLPLRGWSLLGGEVFEDERRLVVRLEIPGMSKSDIVIDMLDDALVVSGEKRFERESSEGRWRVMQCAYGRFRRVVPLGMPVRADQATATYVNGVLRVELPKAQPHKTQSVTVRVE